MRKSFCLCIVVLFSVCAFVQVHAQDKKAEAPQFLFVQSAKTMSFNNGVLTLHGVSPMTIFFSDRPKRIAGHMRTTSFVSHWDKGNNSFKKVPPNAALSIFNDNSTPSEVVVALAEPRLDGNNLTYKAKVLLGELPSEGGESSLFIDGVDGGCDVGSPMYEDEPCWARRAFSKSH